MYLLDSLNICGIRTNHAWIVDVCWKMNTMICLFLISGNFRSWACMNMMNCMKVDEFRFQNWFWSIGVCYAHVACVFGMLFMYWSNWRSHGKMIGHCWFALPRQINEVLRFAAKRASFQNCPHFDSWPGHVFKCFTWIMCFPSMPFHMLHLHFFIFSSTSKIHK